jgi:hypothetical protein
MTRRLAMALTLLTMCLMAAPLSATAASFNPLGAGCDQPQAQSSTVCSSGQPTTDDPISGSNGILVHATHIVAFIAGAAAVILLILGGIRYITSGGDPADIKTAKDTVVYALVGLVVIAVADALVTFVADKL